MRSLPVLLVLTLPLLLAAAELPLENSRIRAVTVYSDRAEVTRTASFQLQPGTHTLLFDNLPARIDQNSLRVEGKGAFVLLDTRMDRIQTTQVTDPALQPLLEQVKAQELQLESLRMAERRLNESRQALGKVLAMVTTPTKETPPEMDAAKWAALLAFHSASLASLDEDTLGNREAQRGIQEEMDRLRREIAQLQRPDQRQRLAAFVTIEAKGSGKGEIDLAYLVYGPSWTPAYEVRVDSATRKLQMIYHAQVRQNTGEPWNHVALRLSTAQPMVGGREPELQPWFLEEWVPVVTKAAPASPRQLARSDAMQQNFYAAEMVGGAAESPLLQEAMDVATAAVETGTTAATFVVASPADILSDNQSSKVTIARETFDTYFRYTCVPKLSPHVYLKAKATNKTDYPFLAGPTAVFFDGTFVANARQDLVAPGQEFWTYLGIDQAIKVERRQLARRTESTGMFGKKRERLVHEFLFVIENNKGTREELIVWDQIPVSNHKDITVTLEEPKYKEDSADLRINERKFIQWRHLLSPSKKIEVPFRFVVDYPEGMNVTGL